MVAINARAAVRTEIGGVERFAREMSRRLPALRPDRYRVIRPPTSLAHRAGHAWEQALLPLQARRCALIYSPANLAPLACGKNVLVLHDLAAFRHPEAYSRAYVTYQRRLLPLLARRARLLVTVSEFSRNELAELLALDPQGIAVIPEGVDEAFAPAAADAVEQARQRYGLERPYVLTMGTLSARKNLSVLDAAARALRERGVELVLGGSDRGYLRGEAVALRRLGYVAEEDLPAVYTGAQAFVLPSRYEGFGLPCLEAMACGTPVLASRAGALPETVAEAGLLLDPGDGDAFAAALLELLTDASARERLTAAGRERAAAFSWARTAELTDRAISGLLGEAPRVGERSGAAS
ncbi:MAG TPA: glycosyltransferase family 1 protein [Solirubrobacteraceae bacterium]|nr:glycosyltransferase family 1 protein [Solirubrobacteraceae bacterium]